LGEEARSLVNLNLPSFAASALAVVLVASCKHAEPAQSSAGERRVADACLQVLRSPLAQETDIDPADARLPEVLRTLHAVHVEVGAGMVVVSFPLHDGLTEYHLAQLTTEPGTWVFYGAGPKYKNEHRELLRFRER
jgi:hypothetical protein